MKNLMFKYISHKVEIWNGMEMEYLCLEITIYYVKFVFTV